MLRLHSITITKFKNYDRSTFPFDERVVGICGLNGQGKTNLLDAIYYCCFTKSYFSSTEAQNVQFNQDGFRLEAEFSKNGATQKLVCIYRGPGKRELLLNGIAYEKMSQHIGVFPAVMVAPDDVELIIGGSEERRRFIDTVISQLDATYLSHLIQYNKIVQQRNSLLKRFAEQGKTDWPLLDVLDAQLLVPGNYIHTARKKFTTTLIPLVQQYYRQISSNRETVSLQYESQLNENSFDALLAAGRQKDCVLQRTGNGIHKDDLSALLNGQPFKGTASQGQRKSLLFALKLAEFDILKNNKGFAPLLFLDDVFEKLDDTRMQQLLVQVCQQNEGQVFITDTHKERLVDAFTSLQVPYQVIAL